MAMSHRLYTMMAIALCAVALSCTRNPDAGGKIRDDLPLHQLRNGDLLFRCGTSTESQVVVSADKNGGVYSHVGIAFNDGGTWRVVHAVPGESADGVDRVKVEPVDSFFLTTRAVHGAAMRLQGCSAQAAQQAAQWAVRKKGVEFDDDYNWTDSTRLYCTELVQRAYETVGVDLSGGRITHVALPFFKGDVVFPSDIQRNDSLTVVFSF